ncbi:MAG: histidine kinase [Bacteroidales bacterium]|nr:histidine kinase [Bacteroidales bacterium]
MNKYLNHRLRFLSSNWFIAIIISIPILIFLPKPERYRLAIEEKIETVKGIYADLNNDGNSERIEFPVYTNLKNVPGIMILENGKVHSEWIISGFNIDGEGNFHIGDYDHNGMKEVYLFTYENDSLFLNGIEPFTGKIIYKRRYLAKILRYKDNVDIQVSYCCSEDITGDNFDELIIFLFAGFQYQNRKTIAVDIHKDSLIESPKSGSVIVNNVRGFDWDHDGLPEFTGWSAAWGNCTKKDYPWTDSIAWLMVLDNDLDYLFDPVPVGKFSSQVNTVPFNTGSRTDLIVLYTYNGLSDSSFIARYTQKGKLVYKKQIDVDNFRKPPRIYTCLSDDYKILYYRDKKIEVLDSLFKVRKTINDIIPHIFTHKIDLDNNGKNEYLIYDNINKKLGVYRNQFRQPVFIDFYLEDGETKISELETNKETASKLVIYNNGFEFIINYSRNRLFWVIISSHLLIYPVILLLVSTISRIQKLRLTQKYEDEKRVQKLQIMALKNQIDPHFTLNMVNTIGSLFSGKDKEEAYNVFVKYSRMLHRTITSSEKIATTLSEELDFVNDYLDIQKFRMDGNLSVGISIDKTIKCELVRIPKLLIHTFVENSFKHAFTSEIEKPVLKIIIRDKVGRIIICIIDNGIGLGYNKAKCSTGKGLTIMKEIAGLFYKIEGVKIDFALEPGLSEGSNPGTKAIVTIDKI